jgi:hydroxyethylthiazole kinase-like uncharacterized protein yjeF
MNLIPSHPVLTCAEAKAWEAGLLKDEAAEWPAMQQAGAKVAHSVLEDFKEIGGLPKNARLLVLAGKGHNGGDALLAAKTILEKYPEAMADVLLCFGETVLRPLARRSLDELSSIASLRVKEVSLEQLKAALTNYDLCLDGIFGFQFRPPMDEATTEVLAWVNAHPAIKFRAAVDLPSGVGEVSAPTVFRADFTYATGVVKSPVLLPANAAAVGRLRYIDLGFFGNVAGLGEPGPSFAKATDGKPGSATPATDQILLPSILAPLTELRSSQSDKRTYGHLFVVGGSHSYPGAVVMAVRAALRSGAGLVTAFVPEKFAPEYAACHPEVMWVGCPVTRTGGLAQGTIELLRERVSRATALLIGPGLGADPETIALAGRVVQEAAVPLVLDADALRLEVVEKALNKPFVCTPHAGEFARIAGGAGLREFCVASGAVVVLKGPMTRVCGRAGLRPADAGQSETGPTVYYSPFGGPVLARGGSGDILAGLIGGLLAQHPEDRALAACRGVVWHGLAADLLARTHGQVTVETSQLLEQLGPALSS